MTILLTGGGTGGHITPILAVAHELKRLDPEVRVVYVGERGGKFAELTENSTAIDASYTIFAGKFRRYYGQGWLDRATDFRTNFMNIRDVLYVLIGTVQALRILRKERPTATLLKGGFVGVPVGLAAALQKRPFVTHDSDAIPGLANRLVGRWAAKHAVALPPEEYAYPPAATVQVGVLTEASFQPVSKAVQADFKRQLEIDPKQVILLVTGGSSGAERLNRAVVHIADKLLSTHPDLVIIHQTGKGKADVYGGFRHDRLKVVEFMRPMYVYTGAADVVVARGSANTIAELGVQRKAVIVVPSPSLAGGHQLKNARRWQAHEAALYVSETVKEGTDAVGLASAVEQLLSDGSMRERLATNLAKLTIPDAAAKLASMLYKMGKG